LATRAAHALPRFRSVVQQDGEQLRCCALVPAHSADMAAAALPQAASSRLIADSLAPLPAPPNPMNKVTTALLWLRRDLRVADNPALVAALQGAVHVVSKSPCVPLTYENNAAQAIW
jgi:DNA photolyase